MSLFFSLSSLLFFLPFLPSLLSILLHTIMGGTSVFFLSGNSFPNRQPILPSLCCPHHWTFQTIYLLSFSCCIKIKFLILLFNTMYLFIFGQTCTISTPLTCITEKLFCVLLLIYFLSYTLIFPSTFYWCFPKTYLHQSSASISVWSKPQPSQVWTVPSFVSVMEDDRKLVK